MQNAELSNLDNSKTHSPQEKNLALKIDSLRNPNHLENLSMNASTSQSLSKIYHGKVTIPSFQENNFFNDSDEIETLRLYTKQKSN